jgi:hypothetical protein
MWNSTLRRGRGGRLSGSGVRIGLNRYLHDRGGLSDEPRTAWLYYPPGSTWTR